MHIECRQVRFRYTDATNWILNDISLVVESGSAVAITGPSGSGKTTLLSLMGLLLTNANGLVLYDGLPVNPGSTISKELGVSWVFQTNTTLGNRSALENAALGALCRGIGRKESLVAGKAALKRVGMEDFAEARARSLSGGQLQRLAVARSLAMTPRALFADEPTSNLDRESSTLVLKALLAHLDGGTTLVIATHDEAIASGCHVVFELLDGRLLRRGLRSRPPNR